LLNNLVFSLERRAIREVWIGGRHSSSTAGRPQQGPIVGGCRFRSGGSGREAGSFSD